MRTAQSSSSLHGSGAASTYIRYSKSSMPIGTDSTRTIPWCKNHENTSPILFLDPGLERPRHAVAPDSPEVHRHEDSRDQRKKDAVQNVESQQGMRSDLRAAENERARIVNRIHAEHFMERAAMSEQRRRTRHVRSDRHRPDRKLIPGQQV